MKINYLFRILFFFVLIWGQNVLGQNENPSVSSAVRYEEYPVDLSTGLPQVGVPIYSLPTRSNDININMGLSYHPSTSVLADAKRSGNCGTGWNLSGGGVVSMTSINSSVYNFNFMGFSGKLNAFLSYASITENSGEKLVVTTQLNTAGTEIIAFNFYDDKGYRYQFTDSDITQVRNNAGVLIKYKTSFQLTAIYDNNNNILANFTYNTYEHQVYVGSSLSHNNYLKFLTEINSPGYGKIELENGYFEADGLWVLCIGIKVKDIYGSVVRNFGFSHDFDEVFASPGIPYTIKNIKLTQVTESASGGIDPQIHKFFYRPVQTVENTVERIDTWGYFNNIYKWCDDEILNWMVDKTRVTEGVLEKMILPTGGCVIYKYESNTYSYDSGTRLDVSNNVINEQFYNNIEMAENRDNFTFTTVASSSVLDAVTPLTFTLTAPTQVYFKINTPDLSNVAVPDGQPPITYPVFTLKNNPGTPALTKIFTKVGSYPHEDKNFSNQENNCLGHTRLLPAGTYTFSINKSTGSVQVYKATLKTTPSKFWYGGGVRIKTIAYFKEDNVPQAFFDRPPFIIPSRTINYNYNVFENPSLSSGSIGTGAIRYKNVTVSDSKLRGKIEYTFLSPIDYPNGNYTSNFQIGKLSIKKIFNDAGVLQLESSYTYNSIPSNISENEGTEFSQFAMGWMVPSQILNKEYFPEGTLQTKDVFTYDNVTRKAKDKTTTTSRSSESLITKYYYHVGNSIYSQNRVGELDYIEEFLGTNLLSTSKIEYSNVWKNNAGTTINVAYLPQQMKSSKGAGALEIKSKINRYDQYGHVLEAEQENGLKKSFVWGYNNTQIIAEIDNIAYSSIPEALITAAQTASNGVNEASLLTALTNLRNATQLADAFITTYTYKPLVGVLSVTDPRGYIMRYLYDASNRQTDVIDQDGNIITKKTYNTKPQN